jgi:aquaporin Z
MIAVLRQHWPEYVMEAAGLGLFMVSAGVFGTLLEYPHSPVHLHLSDPLLRRMIMGLAMGATAVALIYSPWGQQSGAHLNPAVTLTFWRLGKVASPDAVFYIVFQFAGGVTGVLLVAFILGDAFSMSPVNYVATMPGKGGLPAAFTAECIISFVLMSTVLFSSNTPSVSRYTGFFAGGLIFVYILFEAPISGMSMNPARTFASALPARLWTALWIYFTAPVVGMLAASYVFQITRSRKAVKCAKLNHHTSRRCIFHCGYSPSGAIAGGGLENSDVDPPGPEPAKRIRPFPERRNLYDRDKPQDHGAAQ